nr:unnamed protein product [Digitaria exilis]
MVPRVSPSSPLLAVAVVAMAALMMTMATAAAVAVKDSTMDNIQPLSTLKMQAAQVAMDSGAIIHASPDVLGKNFERRRRRKHRCSSGRARWACDRVTHGTH